MNTSICASLLADFNAEAEYTRKVLEATPTDKLTWKPHEKSMSLAQLVGHVAETPGWAGAMMESELDFAAMTDYVPFIPESSESALDSFEKQVQAFNAVLADKTDDFMNEIWTMRMGESILGSMPRHIALRSYCIHHWIHHRGQLTVYLRLLDVSVPPTYGPTADYPGAMAG